MNVICVCVDCLRSDFVGSGYANTPFIDELTDDGLHYESVYATATTTTPAVASIFTGCFSEHNGVNSLRDVELAEDVTTLATKLEDAGYHTTALVTGPLLEDTGLSRGFTEYEYREETEDVYGGWFEDVRDHIETLPEPYFCYIHFWEIHHPIDVPDGFDTSDYGDSEYARGLAGLDRKLATLGEMCGQDTVFLLTGDHGESISTRNNLFAKGLKEIRDKLRFDFGVDTRRVERAINRLRANHAPYPDHYLEDGHGQAVREFTAKVPLVIDGIGHDDTVEKRLRQVDIYPTILDMLDVDFEREDIDGRSLLPPNSLENRVAYTRGCGESLRGQENWLRSVRSDEYRYVEYTDRDWQGECYDLSTDPNELRPLPEDEFDRETLREGFVQSELRESKRIDIDDRLRDLGYL